MSLLFRRFFLLSGGTALSQLTLFLALPVITRLCTPEEFAIYAMASSLTIACGGLFTLRLELAIPRAKTLSSAFNAAITAAALAAYLTLTLAALYFFLHAITPETLPFTPLTFSLISISIIFTALMSIGKYWATRQSLERLSAIAVLGFTGTMLSLQIIFLNYGMSSTGLILGHAFGLIAGTIALAQIIPTKRIHPSKRFPFLQGIKPNKDFIKFSTPALLISQVGTVTPIFLISHFFSLSLSGGFSLAIKTLSAPSALIGQAIGMIAYRELSKKINNEEGISNDVLVLTTCLFGVSIPLFMWIAFYAHPVFTWAFSSDWLLVSEVAKYLAPWFVISFVSSPLSTIPIALHRQKTAMQITLYESALRLGAILLGAALSSSTVALVAYGISGALICAVYIVWILQLAKITAAESCRLVLKAISLAGLMGLFLYLSEYFSGIWPILATLFLALGTSTLALFVTLRKKGHRR